MRLTRASCGRDQFRKPRRPLPEATHDSATFAIQGESMKRMVICACMLVALTAGMVRAERPESTHRSRSESRIAVGELQPTPEMWFYEQYQQQYDDPAAAVRSRAELRAAQRQGRLAAMRWFGQSNSRPQASSDPFHGDYSARWTSNNSHYTNRWMGRATPLIVVRTEESRTR